MTCTHTPQLANCRYCLSTGKLRGDDGTTIVFCPKCKGTANIWKCSKCHEQVENT